MLKLLHGEQHKISHIFEMRFLTVLVSTLIIGLDNSIALNTEIK